jgi:hypothetical protein
VPPKDDLTGNYSGTYTSISGGLKTSYYLDAWGNLVSTVKYVEDTTITEAYQVSVHEVLPDSLHIAFEVPTGLIKSLTFSYNYEPEGVYNFNRDASIPGYLENSVSVQIDAGTSRMSALVENFNYNNTVRHIFEGVRQ